MFKTKTKTFIFVREAPRDQDPGLEDYITASSTFITTSPLPYPKCIAKGRTPGGGVNATDRLSCSTVVFLLNELFVTAHVDDILNTDSNK